jgi:hypothetical protein
MQIRTRMKIVTILLRCMNLQVAIGKGTKNYLLYVNCKMILRQCNTLTVKTCLYFSGSVNIICSLNIKFYLINLAIFRL